ncbi:hypothetical protein FH144_07840 [Staphylococcus caledonicus]|nr:hypothetical protein [Staphylococcus sp. acrmy]MCI2948336.1 hypothetical protein [Staphylococcus sp. acrmy]
MRYEHRATLVKEGQKQYNPDTGKYEVVGQKIYNSLPCNKSPLSPQRTAVEFGEVTRDISLIRLSNRFEKPVTHVYIDNVKYLIVRSVKYRRDTVFYIEEVNE